MRELAQTITVKLPSPVMGKLKRAAELTYRPIGEILASTIDAALVAPPGLPDALGGELAAMRLLSDQALWSAVYPSFSPAQQHRLRQLNHTAGERLLTQAEATEQAALLAAYHRSVLRRAQALAILAERGHPLPVDTLQQTVSDDDFVDSESAA
ncbi:MAG: hypothetical protein CVU38_12740 [Chloroflexi bacterium HGW-Chloroflexi-1]|nr:MAG: hypothetical protein CVU38_12740 [Chloroflexi bacterium HGW-Chloroflexi-1]